MSESVLIEVPPDQILEAMNFINGQSSAIGDLLADCLTRVMDKIDPIVGEFFADKRVGTNGAALLAVLGAHVAFLNAHYPGKMNETLGRAGRYLTVHDDGTVTYDPPPETP